MQTKDTQTMLAGIQDYWTVRAESYSRQNIEEMNNWKREAWRRKILSMAPEKKVLDILDVGTVPGFFAVNLALAGHRVTAVDVTEDMLAHARQNAQDYGAEVKFLRQNGDFLSLPENSFDLVVSRNVIWNLERPKQALREWKRVLRPGGRMVYFDANWYLYLFDEELAAAQAQNRESLRRQQAGVQYRHNDVPQAKIRQLEEIAYRLPLSREPRPAWDQRTLAELGMKRILVQEDISADVLDENERLEYRLNPMFMICAQKGDGGD